MAEAARIFDQPHSSAPGTVPSWSGALHGEVGAMQRQIEQQLSSSAFNLAINPLPVRPLDRIVERVSRLAGWLALAGGFVAAGAVLTLLA